MENNSVYGAAVTGCRIANPGANAEAILQVIRDSGSCGFLVFPDLSITGSTCGDLFGMKLLQEEAVNALCRITEQTKDKTVITGLPLDVNGCICDCAAVLNDTMITGIVPLRVLKGELSGIPACVRIGDCEVPFGRDLKLTDVCGRSFCIVQEGMDIPYGRETVVYLSREADRSGRRDETEMMLRDVSAADPALFIYVTCGPEESTTDSVYPGRIMIMRNGHLLAETAYPELPCCMTVSRDEDRDAAKTVVPDEDDISPLPFLEKDPERRRRQSAEILNMQAYGLYMRLKKTGIRTMVLGVSGGLDSTLALLVCDRVRKMDPSLRIIGVTMPSHGNTSDRTRENAIAFMEALKVEMREIPIHDELKVHLCAIGHADHYTGEGDVVYENAQARIRTLILMDIANMENGLVVGTGDLSELALGWCTYSGDQMSMYGVNASVPKTQVRAICRDTADTCGDEVLKQVLYAIIGTPISPELIPNNAGVIAQKTEDHVGSYEINDFWLYWMVKEGMTPEEMFVKARKAFPDTGKEALRDHLKRFVRRFFSQQFKRSCAPDGAAAGILSLSPRTDWHMPSDADAGAFLERIDRL